MPSMKVLKREDVHDEFRRALDRECRAVFSDAKGENAEMCLPNYQAPTGMINDYTECQCIHPKTEYWKGLNSFALYNLASSLL